MVALKLDALKMRAEWEQAGVSLPAFDIAAMRQKTAQTPTWVHFGAGNIFRGFIAPLQQTLLEKGLVGEGVIAAETYDGEIVERIYRPYDDLALLVTLKADGSMEKKVVASIAGALRADTQLGELARVFEAPLLQMASFTITEKGYALRDMRGAWLPIAERDFAAGPERPTSAMAVVTALLRRRYLAGAKPITLCSMDNCSKNGEKLRAAVCDMARAWQERGLAEDGFVAYVEDESRVSFPWSMIDKITPRPDAQVEKQLEADGIADMRPITTEKHTFIAPFTNAEAPQYLVIEDRFPGGRPPLEEAGVLMTTRERVGKAERMKVTTCLNPLHTALAVYGCVLRMPSIAACMRDAGLSELVRRIGYQEGLPVVTDPVILDPKAFLREVIEQRLPNPFIPDTPQRIASDTSQKVGIRFGETIKAYCESPALDAGKLTYIPLALAGWLRYLLAVDDEGAAFPLSPDPLLGELTPMLQGVRLGEPLPKENVEQLRAFLQNKQVFGANLHKAGLEDKIITILGQLLAGKGAVRQTLRQYLA